MGGRSFDFANDENLTEYQPTAEAMGRLLTKLASHPSSPEMVAEVIWNAAHDRGKQLRFRAGQDAEQLLDARKKQDDLSFIANIKKKMSASNN